MVSVLLVAIVSGSSCVTPEDQTPGWKHQPIPSAMPALAAPEDVEQFRADEPAVVLDPEPRLVHSAVPHVGRLSLSFAVPPSSQHLRVRFAHRLDGMKVDAWARDQAGHAMLLLDGRRVGGDELRLDWAPADVRTIEVTLHHHLRERPTVSEWRAGSWQVVNRLAEAPLEFQRVGTLHWRHPGGRKIELCDSPKRRLELRGIPSASLPLAQTRTP